MHLCYLQFLNHLFTFGHIVYTDDNAISCTVFKKNWSSIYFDDVCIIKFKFDEFCLTGLEST